MRSEYCSNTPINVEKVGTLQDTTAGPEFLNVYGAQESIPRNQFRQAVCVARRAGTTNLFLLGSNLP